MLHAEAEKAGVRYSFVDVSAQTWNEHRRYEIRNAQKLRWWAEGLVLPRGGDERFADAIAQPHRLPGAGVATHH